MAFVARMRCPYCTPANTLHRKISLHIDRSLVSLEIRLGCRLETASPAVRTLLELFRPFLEGLNLQWDIATIGETFLVLSSIGDNFIVMGIVYAIFAGLDCGLSFENGGNDLYGRLCTDSMSLSLMKGSASCTCVGSTA